MNIFLFLIGGLAAVIGLILTIVNAIKKRPYKKYGITLLVGVVVMFIGVMVTPVASTEEEVVVEEDVEEEDVEEEDVEEEDVEEEDVEEEEVEEEKEEVEEEKVVEKENTEYGLDEWWEVEDQWKLKIDSVRFTDERNQFSDKEPEAVVVIKYSYENLGYETDGQDLYMTPDNVIDGEKKVADRYPAGSEVSAKPTPVGAMTEGAEESYGLTSDEGKIDIHFEKYDDDRNKEKVVFTIPLPSE